MNIAEMNLSEYEPISREMFRGKPDCPQMVLSAKGIRFNRQTYDYFKGVEFYYFFYGTEEAKVLIRETEKWDGRRKADRGRLVPNRWKKIMGDNHQAVAWHFIKVAGLDPGIKYRFCGKASLKDGKRTLVFDLDNCVAYVRSPLEEGR